MILSCFIWTGDRRSTNMKLTPLSNVSYGFTKYYIERLGLKLEHQIDKSIRWRIYDNPQL